MTLSVNTDIINLISRRNLSDATNAVSVALERMSTGYKINSAKDNAAGLYVATKLNTQINGLKQAQKNVADGISLIQIADSGLENATTILERLRDLSVQAANSVYDEKTRKAIQAEADALIAQLEQIQKGTQFNGLKVFGEEEVIKPNNTTTNTASVATFNIATDAVSHLTNAKFSVNNTTSQPQISLLSNSATTPVQTLANSTNLIEGSVDVGGNTTTTINIDGVNFKIKNTENLNQTFSYTKNKDTGEVTLTCNKFEITGLSDVEYNLTINGIKNTIYTGERNDIVRLNKDGANTLYTLGGDDKVYAQQTLVLGKVYLGDGNDYFESIGSVTSSYVYGEDGNDTFNITNGSSANIYGNEGDDTFIIGKNVQASCIFNGNEGEDTFDISNTSNASYRIDGGTGTNKVIGNIRSQIAINVPNANYYSIAFNKNETKEILINGIKYTVTNANSNGESAFVYSISNDEITFKSSNFKVVGEISQQHNVVLDASNITFRGGELNDKITISNSGLSCTIYGGKGDDEITINNRYVNVYGEDGNDHIIVNKNQSYGMCVISGGTGDDTIDLYGKCENLEGNEGNDIININTSSVTGSTILGGDGDDTINVNTTNIENLHLLGGNGTNIINGTLTNSAISNFKDISNYQEIELAAKEVKEIIINGKTYKITNRTDRQSSLQYYYDPIQDQVIFGGTKLTINAQDDVEHNILSYVSNGYIYGGSKDDRITNMGSFSNIYGGDGNDTIINNATASSIYGDAGNDKLTINTSTTNCYGGEGDDEFFINKDCSYVYGQEGNDTFHIDAKVNYAIEDLEGDNVFYVNYDNSPIVAGSGNDTFIIKSNNNNITGQGGDDYFEIYGNNNTIDGGTGTNYTVNAGGTSNTISNAVVNPNSGMLVFESINETKTFTVDGKTYTVTNNINSSVQTPNTLNYNYNKNTGELTITGSDFTIKGEDKQKNNILIKGSNNTVSGGRLDDKIIIEEGTNNKIYGKAGKDTLILNSAGNAAYGDEGNDTITVNASTDLEISAGDGDDTLTINANNVTNVVLGKGNDKATINGDGNNVDAQSGDNYVIANGNNNTINAENGNNRLSATGTGNKLQSGSGNNILGVNGDNNTLISQGQLTAYIFGSLNSVTANIGGELNINGDNNTANSSGNTNIDINGNSNNYNSNAGTSDITVKGDSNNLSTTEGLNQVNIRGDKNTYQGGNDIDSVKIRGNENIINGGDSSDEIIIYNGDSNKINGETGDRNMLTDKGTNTESQNCYWLKYKPLDVRLQVGANATDYINVSIQFALQAFELDYSNPETCLENIEIIDSMLNEVKTQRANLGATLNRLDSVSNSQITQIENYTSAYSTIMDADIAEESLEYVKGQILQQTTSALISSTQNAKGNLILNLLKF